MPLAPAAGPAGWTTYHDARNGLEVRFPSAWRRARRSLTPNLVDPVEILSLGTMALAYRAGRCAQLPVGALEAVGPRVVFLSVQERRGPEPKFPPRPRPFRLTAGSAADACVGGPRPWRSYWRPFSDSGRRFYLLAVIGDRASARRVRDLHAVIDSLRFAPVDP
ncbi:MAG: hypothetical protein JWM71_2555, partial [Solirubrobacteraceae bacterium]|nr:hypothetical protein [Solirubrobacteraceae bacterium]